MKYIGLKRIHKGDYLTYYNLEYETNNKRKKKYEMVSHNSEISDLNDLNNKKTDAVVIIMHDESEEKILLNYEYRMAVGRWVYNFPAGLIDDGEDVLTAAAREMREETGLVVKDIVEEWKESYSAVGITNEKVVVVIGHAEGVIKPSDSDMEEIKAGWYTKAEIRKLLETDYFAARTQTYCKLWSRQK